MVAEADYQEYEEPDNSTKMTKHEDMKAPERVIQQRFALRMGMRMFPEEKARRNREDQESFEVERQ